MVVPADSLEIWMAVQPFGCVCEAVAYQCPANAVFPQLESIQTLSRELECVCTSLNSIFFEKV